jgi:hypothetical protein
MLGQPNGLLLQGRYVSPLNKSALSSKAPPPHLPPWYNFVGFHIGSDADVMGLGGNMSVM